MKLFQRHGSLVAAKCENLYSKEGYRDSEYSGNEIADNSREAKHIIENHYDNILDDVVRNVGYGKFHIAGQLHGGMEDDDAIQPVSNEIAGYIATVEGNVVVGNQKGIEPGQQGTIEGVDATDNEKQQKFPGKKVMTDFFDDMQTEGSFQMILLVLWL